MKHTIRSKWFTNSHSLKACIHLSYVYVPFYTVLISSQLGANLLKFSAEINGREMTSKVKETVDEKADYYANIRRDPTEFMMQDKLRDVFMVIVF